MSKLLKNTVTPLSTGGESRTEQHFNPQSKTYYNLNVLPRFCLERNITSAAYLLHHRIYIFIVLQKTFTMEANTMNPDQTAPLGAV